MSVEAKQRELDEMKGNYEAFQQSSADYEAELEEELLQSQNECDRLRTRLTRTEAQLRKARDDIVLLRRQSSEEIAALQERLQSSSDEESLQQVQDLIQKKNEAERRAADEVGYVREELEQVREQNEQLLAELDEMREQYDDIVSTLKHEMRDLKAELLQQSNADPDERDRKYADIIDSLKDELADAMDQIRQLNHDKDKLEARLLDESELNEELTGEVSDLTDDFMASGDRMEQLQQRLKEAEEKLEKFTGSTVAELSSLPSPKGDASAVDLKSELDTYMEKYKKTAGIALQAGRDLDNAKSEVAQLQTHLEGARLELSAVEEAARESNEKLRQAMKERDDATSRLSEVEKEIITYQAKLEKAERTAAKATARADEVEAGVADQARAGQTRVMQLQRERDELLRQLEEVQELKDELNEVAQKEAEKRREAEAKAHREQSLKAKLRLEKGHVQNAALRNYKSGVAGDVVKHLGGLRGVMTGMARDVEGGAEFINTGFTQLRDSFEQVTKILKSAKANYRKEVEARKKLFDEVQDVKGNIKVYCRVRPLLKQELRAKVEECLEFPGNNQVALSRDVDDGKSNSTVFQFDRVYNPMQDQKEVFEDVKQLCLSVLDGYRVCIFAYGQTGSGKTFTMEGPKDNRGINFRACSSLFRQAKSMAPQWTFKAHVSLVEIYNEKLADLLDSESVREMADGLEQFEDNESVSDVADSKKKKGKKKKTSTPEDSGKLEIRKGPHGMYVHGLKSLPVRSAEEVMEVMARGNMNRQVATTNANEHSSRSHSILIVTFDGTDNVTHNKVHGRLQLIDLAGSERVSNTGSSGQRLVEATYINKSLSALGDVMTALSSSKKDKHIPYRNSKLTYMLQDSLGGNSKTMMFVNCSPALPSAQETLCSLQFAKRVRLVQLNATAHQENAALDKYKQRADALKEELKQEQNLAKHSQAKYEEKLLEKDQLISDLNAQIRAKQQSLQQTEMSSKKEISELQSELSRAQRSGGGNSKETEKLTKKLQALQEKHDQVQTLLKHSQRENRKLKEAEKRADKLHVDLKKAKQASQKTLELEQKMDAAQRKARAEELARKRAEAGNSGAEEQWQKKLEDKEQIIRVLRAKNRKLTQEIMNQKANNQHARLPAGKADPQAKARVKARLAEMQPSSKFANLNRKTKLNIPKEWDLAAQLGNVDAVLGQ